MTPDPTVCVKSPQEKVKIVRDFKRPHARNFIDGLFDDFFEIHGDRCFGEDRALLCGIAHFEGVPVTVAGHVKGANLEQNLASNFGMPNPEGYRKFARVVKQAQKFHRPVITFVDTPGAYPGKGAEERGQGEAIAQCLYILSGLETPVITIVTGEGGSGGALALSVADRIYMLEHAIYSILSPEGFASILWKDARRANEACDVMKLTAQDLKGFDMIDGIIPEPEEGITANPQAAFDGIRAVIRSSLEELNALDTQTLLEHRYQRFRKFN
ncbi:MAG: acetyl-CoA carboxylase carboxyltransferase subunit alpha [Coriobacteriales bacterium]|jgi:acetyl-CoA carboxylase carboxyl transferase subunit alpha|nr:acetyl-CoA carboxylase carboxyltransferase subunit alpha [Coriobacteriales bacterium]